ncbi:MAG: hypothetical protein Q9172_005843 [Xanthocarpia lactea]
MAHGFYVSMGGLAFSISADLPESEQFIPNWACGKWFLAADGVKNLFKMHMDQTPTPIPTLTEEEVKSKSKANGLAKALVCAQALWFLTTCVTRYIPTTIESQEVLDLYALAWICTGSWYSDAKSPLVQSMESDYRNLLDANSEYHELQEDKRYTLHPYPKTESELFTSLDSSPLFDSLNSLDSTFGILFRGTKRWMGFPPIQDRVRPPIHQPYTNGQPASITFMPGDVLPDTDIRLKTTMELDNLDSQVIGGFLPALPSLSLTRLDINRMKMAKRATKAGRAVRSREEKEGVSNPFSFSGLQFRQHCGDMPSLSVVLYSIPVAVGFSAAAVIYGGLHALAWFAHFNSPTEKLLWRLSACAVMGGIPIMVAINKLVRPWGGRYWYMWFCLQKFHINLREILMYTVCTLYTLARLYLVIESFKQLSHLPAGVYTQPDSSNAHTSPTFARQAREIPGKTRPGVSDVPAWSSMSLLFTAGRF